MRALLKWWGAFKKKMIPINKGNLLPAYEKKAWQPHRWRGGDAYPNCLVAPRTKLLPFQAWFGGAVPSIYVWELVRADNDGSAILLSNSLLFSEKADGSGYWVTWTADEELSEVPDCGYWYIRLTQDGSVTYFAVMELVDLCGFNSLKMTIDTDSCSSDGTDITIPLVLDIYAAEGYVFTIEHYNLGYEIVSANDATYSQVTSEALEEARFRVVMTSICGDILTVYYTVTWDSSDPCATLAIEETSRSTNNANIGRYPTWRIVAANGASDKGNVLYQFGYTQYYYIQKPVWDIPLTEREVQKTVDGNGNETIRFSRTVARYVLEFPDVPDYAAVFLSKLGDLSGVVFQDVESNAQFVMSNCEFETRRAGPFTLIGRLSFDAEIEAFAGCQENFELL